MLIFYTSCRWAGAQPLPGQLNRPHPVPPGNAETNIETDEFKEMHTHWTQTQLFAGAGLFCHGCTVIVCSFKFNLMACVCASIQQEPLFTNRGHAMLGGLEKFLARVPSRHWLRRIHEDIIISHWLPYFCCHSLLYVSHQKYALRRCLSVGVSKFLHHPHLRRQATSDGFILFKSKPTNLPQSWNDSVFFLNSFISSPHSFCVQCKEIIMWKRNHSLSINSKYSSFPNGSSGFLSKCGSLFYRPTVFLTQTAELHRCQSLRLHCSGQN